PENITLFWCNASNNDLISPFAGMAELHNYWSHSNSVNILWDAPDGLFWICGRKAYTKLLKDWRGICTIGTIQPGYFLLPKTVGKHLDIPV
ncbi:ENR1 protein, partial [Drymodes brunneopygia]|nr:ENR1 protein [Drymodes brunneopygia]